MIKFFLLVFFLINSKPFGGLQKNVKYRFNRFIIGRPVWSFNEIDAEEVMDHSGSSRSVRYVMNLFDKITSDNYLPDPEKVSEEFAEAARKDRAWRIMNILRGENF